MNCLQFYDACARGEYMDNPKRAEELYKYAQIAVSEALDGKKCADMEPSQFGGFLFKYWHGMGLSWEQCNNMLTFISPEWKNKHLRIEFDEAWVEYGFLVGEG